MTNTPRETTKSLSRRTFLGTATLALASVGLAGCSTETAKPDGRTPASEPEAPEQTRLPDAAPDPESPFGVDEHVNMDTIDNYLGLDGVVYRELRMIEDPANYAAIGGSPNLDVTIEGFKITPFPYLATLAELPVEGAYTGDTLFDVAYDDSMKVTSATPIYEQSLQIIEELFPRDKDIVLMCGGAGYAGMMRNLLIFLGWDERRVYNIGGGWDYSGYHTLELISYDKDDTPVYHLWRGDNTIIDFSHYTPLS